MDPSSHIFENRGDLSPYLFHWTRSRTVWKGLEEYQSFTAIQVLEKILSEERLKGGLGAVVGDKPCICFSETPLEHMITHFKEKLTDKYEPYGIGVRKLDVFNKGGRPVIYSPKSEIIDEVHWRHVTLDLPKVNWTWEREWRIQADDFGIQPDHSVAIVPNKASEDFLKKRFNGKWKVFVLPS